jgi:2-keto-4-pentenoate hydratase/2-oxohepta-3-ene-1,7-dioic acid hydratase in catechol pathway
VRLARIGELGQERPYVLLEDGQGLDVTAAVGDFDREFFGGEGLSRLTRIVAARAGDRAAPPPMRIGAPVAGAGKIVCVGLNYVDHAKESGAQPPKEPVLFLKASNTIVGPYDDVRIPRGSSKTDWEVELGVVIGRQCRYLGSDADALACVAGYMVCNDVSERSFQLEAPTARHDPSH